jgi:HK97 family phage portal protein
MKQPKNRFQSMSSAASALYNNALKYAATFTGETGRATNADELARMLTRGAATRSGQAVNVNTAMQVSTVYACVRILAESVAMLPLRLFESDANGGETVAQGHVLDRLLNKRPNASQTPYEFKRLIVGMLALRGNVYLLKFNLGGKFPQLIPLHPDRVKPIVDRDGFTVHYEVQMNGRKQIMTNRDILHMRGLSSDGLVGMSIIQAAAEAIGLSIATESHGAHLFANSASPSGVLQSDGEYSDAAYKRLKDSFEEQYVGSKNSGRPMLLEEGLKWERMGMTADEAQFLETRKFQRSEITAFFGVPPHMVGDVDKATSWGSGIEQQGIGFVVYTLLPWLTNLSQGFERGLLTSAEADRYGFKFNTDLLTQGEFKNEQEGLEIQKRNGVINANEWRRRIGLNPREDEGGDAFDGGNIDPSVFAQINQTKPWQIDQRPQLRVIENAG